MIFNHSKNEYSKDITLREYVMIPTEIQVSQGSQVSQVPRMG